MVVHGLSAMAVYGEIIGVRLLCTTVGLIVVVATVLAAGALGRPISVAQVPAWAALAAGTLLVMLAQAVVMAFVFVFIVLGSRAGLSFLPIRDYAYFVGEVRTVSGRDC